MAITYQDYTGNGSETDYDVTFDFLETSDVKVSINGTTKTVTADYTVNGSSSPPVLTFTSSSIPANNDEIRIYRNTDADSPKHTHQAGSSIKAGDLNNNQQQVLYKLQEIGTVTGNTEGLALNTGNKNDITVNSATDWVIRSGVIEESMMADNSIDSDSYVDGSIERIHLEADIINSTKLADDAVDSEHYVDGSIDSAHIANDQIDSQHYAAASIDNEHLADDAVDSDEIAAGAVDLAHLSASGTKNSTTFLRGDNSFAVFGGLFTSYAILQYVVGSTSGGGSSSTSWAVRYLNTESADPDNIVTLSSNSFTLGAGNYLIKASACSDDIESFRLRIYDTTNSAERILGTNAYGATAYTKNTWGHLAGRVTPSGSTTYQLQQISDIARSNTGHGVWQTLGGNEIYTIVEIYKEA